MKQIVELVALAVAIVTPFTTVNETYISATAYNACEEYGEGYDISPELLMAIIEVESGGDPKATLGGVKG